MSPLAALCLALVGAPQETDLAPTARAEARLEASVASAQVGEPFTLELEVLHASGDAPSLDATGLEAEPAWALLDGGEHATVPDPRREGAARTSASWTIAALAAGELELPAPLVTFAGADGKPQPLEVARGTVAVRAVLAPGEDEPRPLGDLVGLAAERPAGVPWPWLVAAASLAAGGAWVLVRRRRRVAPPAAGPSPLARLRALEEAELESTEAVREAHFELARALREEIDLRLRLAGVGLTDDEWVRRVEERVGAQRARPMRELLAACEPVKYGAEGPTHWATRERIVAAVALAADVEQVAAFEEVAR